MNRTYQDAMGRNTGRSVTEASQHHVLRRDGSQHRAIGHQWQQHHGLRPDGSADRNDQREQVTGMLRFASTQDTKSIRPFRQTRSDAGEAVGERG